MGKKLYVGNLSYTTDSSALQELFAQHGTVVSAQVINDRETGEARGLDSSKWGAMTKPRRQLPP